MTETNNLIKNIIKNIIVDVIIITNIWVLLNNNTYKYFFGLGVSIYLLKKYI
jgi:hypothetical protein